MIPEDATSVAKYMYRIKLIVGGYHYYLVIYCLLITYLHSMLAEVLHLSHELKLRGFMPFIPLHSSFIYSLKLFLILCTLQSKESYDTIYPPFNYTNFSISNWQAIHFRSNLHIYTWVRDLLKEERTNSSKPSLCKDSVLFPFFIFDDVCESIMIGQYINLRP